MQGVKNSGISNRIRLNHDSNQKSQFWVHQGLTTWGQGEVGASSDGWQVTNTLPVTRQTQPGSCLKITGGAGSAAGFGCSSRYLEVDFAKRLFLGPTAADSWGGSRHKPAASRSGNPTAERLTVAFSGPHACQTHSLLLHTKVLQL